MKHSLSLHETDDYLKLSSLSIQFGSSQQIIRSLILKNSHETIAIAYKIKTNNLQALQATPNFGFIRGNTAISLRIKAIPEKFQAKLLISYANVGERPGEFNQVWTGLPKGAVKSKQVRVWRGEQPENFKFSNKNTLQIPKLSKQNTHTQRSRSQDRSRRNYGPKYSTQLSQSELASNLAQTQLKLSQQQLTNAKIKQQLQITEQKLKQINQQRLQIKVNKSIGIVCEDYHTSFVTLLLYGLAVFVTGYVLAKWEK